MNYEVEPIILNTDDMIPPVPASDPWENRNTAYYMYDMPGVPTCSILVQGYNRLHKTKYCVECILKYTQDVEYELILIDSGSDDGTYEFFQSVPYENKRVIRITKNISTGFPMQYVLNIFRGKYLVQVSNDVYVTQNWLSNLLKCYESDKRIGFVEPVSSNVSNLQQVDLDFLNFDEMQKQAAAFNVSNPLLWEERMRLISIISIWSRQILHMVGVFDPAYMHDFSEDDLMIRLRRSGYKLKLCRDTWICHDHDFRNMEDKDPTEYQKSLESGRAIYRDKYHGIDAWDDFMNYEPTLLTPLDSVKLQAENLRSLVVDGRCGTPVLEIRNSLRKRNITDIKSYAFTTKAKYYLDLQTIADEVQCDRIDFIQSCYADNTFDIVALCEPINIYPSPIMLLQRLYNFLKPNGVFLFKLRNIDDYNSFLRSSGLGGNSDGDLPSVLSLNDVHECLTLFGGRDISAAVECEELSQADQNTLLSFLRLVRPNANNDDLIRFITKNYLFCVTKG